MTFSLFQFATSKLVPNKAMVPACIMQLQKTQAKHQSRLVVRTYTISDIYDVKTRISEYGLPANKHFTLLRTV